MHEDNLTRDDRIRIAALTQAVLSNTSTPSPQKIIFDAHTFEAYIRSDYYQNQEAFHASK